MKPTDLDALVEGDRVTYRQITRNRLDRNLVGSFVREIPKSDFVWLDLDLPSGSTRRMRVKRENVQRKIDG